MLRSLQVERTPLHTPSSPPLSSYAVAAPLISDEEDDEEEDSEENEAFVGEEESEADPISRFGYYTLNYGDTDIFQTRQ